MLTDAQLKLYKQNGPVFQCFRLFEEIAEFLQTDYSMNELADVFITLRYPIKMFNLTEVAAKGDCTKTLYISLLEIQWLLLKYFRGVIKQEQMENLAYLLVETYYFIEKQLKGWEYLVKSAEEKLSKEVL